MCCFCEIIDTKMIREGIEMFMLTKFRFAKLTKQMQIDEQLYNPIEN